MIGYSKTILSVKHPTKYTVNIPVGTQITDHLRTVGPVFFIKHLDKYRFKAAYILCLCKCGNYTVIKPSGIDKQKIRSCGCWSKSGCGKPSLKHGDAAENKKSGLYSVWGGMKSRCNNNKNRKYHIYGGKGIKICAEWLDYAVFKKWALNNGYQDIQSKNASDKLSLDRIDSNKDYCPENCRWVTRKQNSKNVTAERDKKIRELELDLIWGKINDWS